MLLALVHSEMALTTRWFGAALATVSFGFATVARIQLGRFFSVNAPPKGLVTHGLYARLQHPMFLFVDLTIFGLALALAQPLLLAILLILVPLQIRRSRNEDRLLEEKFGQAYREYRKHTWF